MQNWVNYKRLYIWSEELLLLSLSPEERSEFEDYDIIKSHLTALYRSSFDVGQFMIESEVRFNSLIDKAVARPDGGAAKFVRELEYLPSRISDREKYVFYDAHYGEVVKGRITDALSELEERTAFTVYRG